VLMVVEPESLWLGLSGPVVEFLNGEVLAPGRSSGEQLTENCRKNKEVIKR